MTSRGPLTLAALASAAVPGLDPDTVEGVVASGPADAVEVAFIQDREHRRWVIRCPRTPAASAQLERSAALLAVLARRLTMPVPTVRGWAALPEGGRAGVHSYLTGRLVTFEGIEAGSSLAIGLGRALAHLHNLDVSLYEEAGVPVYDAASYRTRRLAELDRAAATGRVPTALLNRWERVLDDASLWTFTATPTHGAIGPDTVLASPDDGTDLDVKAFLAWESAQVADPADDMAPLLATMDAEAFETVREAYAHTRVDRPDRNLYQRAEIIGEMQLVRTMMAAVAAGDDAGAEECAAQLRRLDDRLARAEEEAARTHATASTTAMTEEVPRLGVAGAETGGGTKPSAATTPSAPTKPSPEAKPSPATKTADSTTSTPDKTEKTQAKPAKAPPAEATSTRAAAAGSDDTETQPVPVQGRQRGSARPDQPVATDAAAGTSAESVEDAVQVEHRAVPTPVTTPAPKAGTPAPAPTAPVPAPIPTHSADTDPTATAGTESTSAAPTPQPSAPRQWTPPAATPLRDAFPHDADDQTAEIVPINDDGDDDVRPIGPRK